MFKAAQVVLVLALMAIWTGCGTPVPQKVHPTYLEGDDWELVWHDEFDIPGAPDPTKWTFERGFVRNKELQWYQPDNAVCRDSILVIEGRQDFKRNPNFDMNARDWRTEREFIEFTSSSLKTQGKFDFRYGCLEVRAQIPTTPGSWPAIWLLGTNGYRWPHCGEIDVMEFYRVNDVPHILANVAHGGAKPGEAVWFTKKVPFQYFLNKDLMWGRRLHIWTMDWTPEYIRLYLDGELLNEVSLAHTVNQMPANEKVNPFHSPHYILLNLAIGATGGTPRLDAFPLRYYIDYVRVYQRKPKAD